MATLGPYRHYDNTDIIVENDVGDWKVFESVWIYILLGIMVLFCGCITRCMKKNSQSQDDVETQQSSDSPGPWMFDVDNSQLKSVPVDRQPLSPTIVMSSVDSLTGNYNSTRHCDIKTNH